MTHHVDHTGPDLLFRKRKEKFGINDAHKRTDQRRTGAELSVSVRNHNTDTLFAACSRKREHSGNRKRFCRHNFLCKEIPNIANIRNADGYCLRSIDDASTPDSEDRFNSVLAGQKDTFLNKRKLRVRSHAAQFNRHKVGSF